MRSVLFSVSGLRLVVTLRNVRSLVPCGRQLRHMSALRRVCRCLVLTLSAALVPIRVK